MVSEEEKERIREELPDTGPISEWDPEDVAKAGALGGAPEGSKNALKHGLTLDRQQVWEYLSDREKRIAIQMSTDLIERLDEQAGMYEREAIRNIVLDSIKRGRANDWILTQDAEEWSEYQHNVYKGIVNTMTREMKELGLTVDTEKERALEAEASWYDAMVEAMEDE